MAHKRKAEDKRRDFQDEWTDLYAVFKNSHGLPTCLICNEKFNQNKKSNLDRHFNRKHASFKNTYASASERTNAVRELQRKQEKSASLFKKWKESSSNLNMASYRA